MTSRRDHQRVPHSFRDLPRTSTLVQQTRNRQDAGFISAPLPCLPCICSVSCAQLSFTLEPDNGLCNTHDECACESSLSDVTSSVQTESRCCVSMACGWCVPQTLLLARRTNFLHLDVLALCRLTLQTVGSVRSTLSKTVCTPLRSASARRKSQRVPFNVGVLHFPGHHGHLAAPATSS